MALFRRRTAEVLKRSTRDGDVVEERKTLRIGGQTVEVKRVEDPLPKSRESRSDGGKGSKADKRSGRRDQRTDNRSRGRANGRPPVEQEIIIPTDVGKRQMLVRSAGSQTQVVILEGPLLVEHYVARPDRSSMVGNIYLAKVRNVLPGMEASFLDFGAAKNGVLYSSDVGYDRKKNPNGPPRIEDSFAEGDEVLVQVVKDPMGAKGARLTGTPSLPGRYLVLVPDSDTHGISRRLPEDDRTRLRQVIDAVKPDGYGVIVRTAAMHATAEEIAADISRLVKTWEKIAEKSAEGGAPRAIYEEPDLLIRVIREHFTADFRRMLIEGRDAYDKVTAYLRATAPDLVSKVQIYGDELNLFERYHVDDQLRKALDRRVYLPSGGHLVIDRTEALTVIDVNTGKFVGSSSLEETVLQNNLEAAEEIGRQLRLRDIGGIIVIDFIDMEEEKNQQAVLRQLRETLARDKTRTQVFDVSHLGLVEMTRKNVSAGLLEHFSETCPHCEGRGVLVHEDAVREGLPVVVAVEAD
ncbi:hypothetical protein BH23ACT5_BH23ACT5_06090 [soil metagenome]